jgi:hypothetical protein
VDALSRIADQKKAAEAQVELAWLLAQKPWIVPIPGTTKRHRLEENLGGADVELTRDDLKVIHDAVLAIAVQGESFWVDSNQLLRSAMSDCSRKQSTVEPRVTYPEMRLFGQAARSLF